jgi:hypothetical protein
VFKNYNIFSIVLKQFFYVGIKSWSADKLSFYPYEARFYKTTVLKVPFVGLPTAHAKMPGSFPLKFDLNEKMVSLVGVGTHCLSVISLLP